MKMNRTKFAIWFSFLTLFLANQAHAAASSGVYNLYEKFSDGSTLKGKITYDAESDSITAASLQLTTSHGIVKLDTPYQAYDTEDGFVQRIIDFNSGGMVSVTLVLNTSGDAPKFDSANMENVTNSYIIDSSEMASQRASIAHDENVNKITPASTAES